MRILPDDVKIDKNPCQNCGECDLWIDDNCRRRGERECFEGQQYIVDQAIDIDIDALLQKYEEYREIVNRVNSDEIKRESVNPSKYVAERWNIKPFSKFIQEKMTETIRDMQNILSNSSQKQQDAIIHQLAEWLAIQNNETRLQADKYLEDAQELDVYLRLIGYVPIGR